MGVTRFKGENGTERLILSTISDADMVQVRHKPGTVDDADKGVSKSVLQSIPFAVSTTAAGTGTKVAALVDSNPDFTLLSGREVVVFFQNANSAANPSLNFAGSGPVPIYKPNGSPVGAWDAGVWISLKYFEVTIDNVLLQRWLAMSPIASDGNVGDIKAISYTEVPNGWLECNGQAVSRTTYAELFNVYNTQTYDGEHTLLSLYGTGDGSTTFNLPDYREVALVGAGQNGTDSIADHDVYTVGQFKDDQVQNHTHNVVAVNSSQNKAVMLGSGSSGFGCASSGSDPFVYEQGQNGRKGDVTRGKRKAVKYIIKVL